MFYVSDGRAVYQAHSRDIAEMVGPNPEEMDFDVMNIDFGGCTMAGMETIELEVNGSRYALFAHHLNNLVHALADVLKYDGDYVAINGYPFSYALARGDAEALTHLISQNWNEYRAMELHNIQLYRDAIGVLSGSGAVDVQREIANLPASEVN